MIDDDGRLKFYGMGDHATFMTGARLLELANNHDDSRLDYGINEIIEFYNVIALIDKGVLPKAANKTELAKINTLKPKFFKSIATFFEKLDESNIAKLVVGVPFQYHDDLIKLLVKYRHHERIPATAMLDVLKTNGVQISTILESKPFVVAYDVEIHALMISSIDNAEIVISKLCERDGRRVINFPPSFKPIDVTKFLNQYIESNEPNPNYLELIADSRILKSQGLDAKTKLKARQRYDAWTDEFFKGNQGGGIRVGVQVGLADKQTEPLVVTEEDGATRFSYSRPVLDQNSDPAAILGVFVSLLEFVDKDKMLVLPSYQADLGVTERFLRMHGKDTYPTGISFQFKEMVATAQTMMYDQYLNDKPRNLEQVLEWFFNEHIKSKYDIDGFSYTASTKSATYLMKCRNVFAEMDSVIKQFSLYAENDEIDQELFHMSSEPVAYEDIPSLLEDKYAIAITDSDISMTLYHLFSDQSGMTYINDTLTGKNMVDLFISNKVMYSDLLEFQLPIIDNLIEQGVLINESGQVVFRSKSQVYLLRRLYNVGALNYNLYPQVLKDEIDLMFKDGWLEWRSTLLTHEESSLFNYYLNQRDFGNGLDLRNKYLHGSQASSENEKEHYRTYIITLMLMFMLVIKINYDLLLKEKVNSTSK